MAYLKPSWFTANVFNKIAMATGMSGTESLTLTARSSGAMQTIPVVTVEVDGTRYLVSTRGESQWVKNVRAKPAVTLTTKSGATPYRAAEVPLAQRGPILDAYRRKLGKTVDGYFAKLPDPADHPVFSLSPA
ncbi:nitroreductase/quinone reductase family protein [Mycobacterium sp. NBC_00419]|uniref:nitroreductase/quinone reductase family protein n=1 Tax=Mycobacterium sp. NBC_00419 TaxID=2975989 RepID=UPI002E211F2A